MAVSNYYSTGLIVVIDKHFVKEDLAKMRDSKLKRKIINNIDRIYLFFKFPKSYFNYWFINKKKIYKLIKDIGITKIKPAVKQRWKLAFNISYYSGILNDNGVNKTVFVKVDPISHRDCVENEKVASDYICNNSEYMRTRMPKFYFVKFTDAFIVSVQEFLDFSDETSNVDYIDAIRNVVSEFTRIGVLHADFKRANICFSKGEYFVFDYGQTLCPLSGVLRKNGDPTSNHLDKVISDALALIPDPDYYYDDIVHCNLQDSIDRNGINFMVGKGDRYLIRLNNVVYEYALSNCGNENKEKIFLVKIC